jgi:hypothetical protein
MKRLRRCKIVTPSGVLGLVDISLDDQSEWNREAGDDEACGDVVRMSEGPFEISFEMAQHNSKVVTGYVANFVFEQYEVANNSGTGETKTTKTFTLTQGYFNVGAQQNHDNPGRVRVQGNFKTLVIT